MDGQLALSDGSKLGEESLDASFPNLDMGGPSSDRDLLQVTSV